MGLSSPSWCSRVWMTCGGTGGLRPLRSAIGSPEFATSRNTSTVDSSTSGIAISRRRMMKLSMASPHEVMRSRRGPVPPPARVERVLANPLRLFGLLGPGVGVPEGAVLGGVVGDVHERVAEGEEGRLVVQRDRGHVVGHDLVDLVQQVGRLVRVELGARLREQLVDLGVGVLAVVAAGAAAVDVPVAGDGERAADPGEFFFFNDTATTEIYTLSLHDALPI